MTYREMKIDGLPTPPRRLMEIARDAADGEVSLRHHAASRARVADRYAEATRPRRFGRGWGIVAIAAVALPAVSVVGLAATIAGSVHRTPVAVTTPGTVSDPVPSPAPLPLEINPKTEVVVRATPADARVYFDDVLVATNPASISARRDGLPHRIRVEAVGHLPTTTMVVFDQPHVALSVSLQEIGKPGSTSTSTSDRDNGHRAMEVAEVVAKHRPAFRGCYQRGLSSDPNMSGSASIRVSVRPDGRVEGASVASNEGLSREVADCLASVLAGATFKGTGARETVTIPVAFKNDGPR